MAVTAPRLRLATEHGRRIARTPKAVRVAAQPATDAARLMRALAAIRREAEKGEARARDAEKVLQCAFQAACGEDRITARALAREALIEARMTSFFALIVRYCEAAEDGTLCA